LAEQQPSQEIASQKNVETAKLWIAKQEMKIEEQTGCEIHCPDASDFVPVTAILLQ
jgi:hypothetical protein